MKKFIIFIIAVISLAGCTKQDSAASDSELLDKIWTGFNKFPGNDVKGESYLNLKGEILKKGFVPPSALATSAKEPLPAYLACYDFVRVYDGLGDIESNICVYYVDNPTRDTYSVMWRGRQYMNQLEAAMVNDGFTTSVVASPSNISKSPPPQVVTPVSPPPQVVTVPPVVVSTSSTEISQEIKIDNVASSEAKVSNQDFAPSFDCLKANSGQDRLVCDNKDLSKLDVQLSVLYSKARSKTAEKDTLKQEQLQWYKYQRNACSDIECLSNAYQSRIFELSQKL